MPSLDDSSQGRQTDFVFSHCPEKEEHTKFPSGIAHNKQWGRWTVSQTNSQQGFSKPLTIKIT